MNYFVTGTDTGVGKTLISCALLHGFAARGMRVAGFKPVAAGCNGDGQNEDALQLRAAANVTADYGQINPYCFLPAIAPHIAAQRAGVTIDISVIAKSYKELAEKAELVIVEGAGGLLVPLNAQRDCAGLAKELALPVILVVGMRLGCLNHALLTVEAIAARGLTLSGWVANVLDGDGMTRRCTKSRQSTIQQAECGIDTEASGAGMPSSRLLPQSAGYAITSDLASVVGSPSRMASSPISNVSKAAMPALQENIEALRERIASPLLGVVPYMTEPDARVAAGQLHLERLEP